MTAPANVVPTARASSSSRSGLSPGELQRVVPVAGGGGRRRRDERADVPHRVRQVELGDFARPVAQPECTEALGFESSQLHSPEKGVFPFAVPFAGSGGAVSISGGAAVGERRRRPPRPRKRHVLGFRRRLVVGVFAHQVDVDGRRGVRWYQFGRNWPLLTASMNGVFRGSSYARRGPSFTVNPLLQNVTTCVCGASAAEDGASAVSFAAAAAGPRLPPRWTPGSGPNQRTRPPERGRPRNTRTGSGLQVLSRPVHCAVLARAVQRGSHPVGADGSIFFASSDPAQPSPTPHPRVPLRGLVVVVVPAAVRGLAEVTEAATLPLPAARVERASSASGAQRGQAAAAATGAAPGPDGRARSGRGIFDREVRPHPRRARRTPPPRRRRPRAADSRKKRALSASAHPVTVANSASLPSRARRVVLVKIGTTPRAAKKQKNTGCIDAAAGVTPPGAGRRASEMSMSSARSSPRRSWRAPRSRPASGAASSARGVARARPPTVPSVHASICGIDLGTTNSCVAVVIDGRPVLVPDEKGRRTIPSVVHFAADGSVAVGTSPRSA